MSMRVIVCVTTDLVTDQRVNKVCASLLANNFEIVLVGRELKKSLPMPTREYPVYRFKLPFEKGPLFYATYNIRLFFFLLFSKASIIVANDLDTLLAVYIASKFKKAAIVYDNHEYYTGMPELVNRPKVKAVWKRIERFIFPKLTYIMTDNDSKRKLFEQEYNLPVVVVRNVPIYRPTKASIEVNVSIPEGKKVLLYQGAGININRGAEELTKAMVFLDDSFLLCFVGSGDVIAELKKIVKENKLENKVLFTGKVPLEILQEYTRRADLGFTLDKPICENYIYSLPNKLFDYVHAGVPILANRLMEVEYMISKYDIGTFIDSYDPSHIASKIKDIFSDPLLLKRWKDNLPKAAKEVNWQNEEKALLKLYNQVRVDLLK